MYKLIQLLVRKETLTHEEFLEHWQNACEGITHLKGLKQYRTVLPTTPESAEFDGIAELHFETVESLHDALGTEGTWNFSTHRETVADDRDDSGDFLQAETVQSIVGKEVIEKDEVDGETDGLYKHSAFLDRKEGMSQEAFFEYWADEHAPIAREVPGVVRYVRVIPTSPERAAFDGVAELYFESLDALRAALGHESSRDYAPDNPAAKALREDAENLHSIDGRPRFIGTEFVQIDRI
ncbi:EthD family reductase [Natronobeatus ordinarius]|uniref:EthD domain-containing protein n=1 Tax=Natronobeatus ordinarius TaxID=2963433 RepID=UPI0020CDEFE3|nr:EthD family reductase [Natronobeatus ordinarius]